MKHPTPLRPLRGVKRKKSRRGPVRDPEYLAWIRTRACVGCWPKCYNSGAILSMIRSGWPLSEAAHTGSHGISQKASDRNAIPLCVRHHREGISALDRIGPKAFERVHNINLAKIRTALQAEYERMTTGKLEAQ